MLYLLSILFFGVFSTHKEKAHAEAVIFQQASCFQNFSPCVELSGFESWGSLRHGFLAEESEEFEKTGRVGILFTTILCGIPVFLICSFRLSPNPPYTFLIYLFNRVFRI
jgi:hypothetical protein